MAALFACALGILICASVVRGIRTESVFEVRILITTTVMVAILWSLVSLALLAAGNVTGLWQVPIAWSIVAGSIVGTSAAAWRSSAVLGSASWGVFLLAAILEFKA